MMIEPTQEKSAYPQTEAVVYFDAYCDVVKYAAAVPSASANIAYFEPSLQKWAMVNHEE